MPPQQGWTPVPESGGDTSAWTPVDEPGPPVPSSAAVRFGEGFLRNNPITNTYELGKGLLTDPGGTAQNVIDASGQRLDQAIDAFHQGRPLASALYGLAATPLIGPAVANTVERARSGDVAGALGEATGMAIPFSEARGAAGAVGGAALDAGLDAARKIPGVSDVLNKGADAADASANARMAREMTPTGGANKTRFAGNARDVAPSIVRGENVTAWTQSGLAAKITDKLRAAEDELDSVSDARLNARHFETQPIIDDLLKARQQLEAQPVEGTKIDYSRTANLSENQRAGPNPGGQGPLTVTDQGPIGNAVVPGPNSARVAMIDQAIAEVRQLGPIARYAEIRKIRQAYDGPARAIYSPSMTADYMKAQGGKLGAADVTGALRSHLAQLDPLTDRTANDAMAAAAEVEQSRPAVARKLFARLTGSGIAASVGISTHSLPEALVAGAIPMAVEAAARSGFTTQIKLARGMAALADAMRGGNTVAFDKALGDIRRSSKMTTALKLALPAGQLVGGPPVPSGQPSQDPTRGGPPKPP
jgi:hypothetical protein